MNFSDRIPETAAELARTEVELPRLEPDTEASCPVELGEVVDYLRMESLDGEAVQAGQLRFLRTASIAGHRYWIWEFQEADGGEAYATVSLAPGGAATLGYETNEHGLTPEQFVLGDHYEVL